MSIEVFIYGHESKAVFCAVSCLVGYHFRKSIKSAGKCANNDGCGAGEEGRSISRSETGYVIAQVRLAPSCELSRLEIVVWCLEDVVCRDGEVATTAAVLYAGATEIGRVCAVEAARTAAEAGAGQAGIAGSVFMRRVRIAARVVTAESMTVPTVIFIAVNFSAEITERTISLPETITTLKSPADFEAVPSLDGGFGLVVGDAVIHVTPPAPGRSGAVVQVTVRGLVCMFCCQS